MSHTQFLNLCTGEVSQRLNQFISDGPPRRGVLRCVLTFRNNDWSFLMGSLTFVGDISTEQPTECLQKYPNYQFICQIVEKVDLEKLLDDLDNRGVLSLSKISDSRVQDLELEAVGHNWTEAIVPSHAHSGGVPVRRFSARITGDTHCADTKLIAHNLPFRSSSFEYLQEFLGLDEFYGSFDGRKGEFCIEVPDKRGRLLLSEEGARFSDDGTASLSLVGTINDQQVSLLDRNSACSFKLENMTDVELWLVTEKDEVVDFCSSSEWEYRFKISNDKNDKEKLLQMISSGESEHCEFKPYIDLSSRKGRKAWEIDVAVCALSNHEGGVVFVGVADDATVTGINLGCERDYKSRIADSSEAYRRDVEQRLRESLVKNQCFDTRIVEFDEGVVLVIEVRTTSALNSLRGRNDAFIRRGASSPRMTPNDIEHRAIQRASLRFKD